MKREAAEPARTYEEEETGGMPDWLLKAAEPVETARPIVSRGTGGDLRRTPDTAGARTRSAGSRSRADLDAPERAHGRPSCRARTRRSSFPSGSALRWKPPRRLNPRRSQCPRRRSQCVRPRSFRPRLGRRSSLSLLRRSQSPRRLPNPALRLPCQVGRRPRRQSLLRRLPNHRRRKRRHRRQSLLSRLPPNHRWSKRRPHPDRRRPARPHGHLRKPWLPRGRRLRPTTCRARPSSTAR